MFQIKHTIGQELTDAIDLYLYEEESSPWSLLSLPPGKYFLQGGFESEAQAKADWETLRASFPELPEDAPLSELKDSDWKDTYKQYLKPWSTSNLHWIPLWEKESYTLPEGAVSIYLDAGMAFGTGAHETTRLCAQRLIEYRDATGETLSQKTLIDAGCGSGILALSAIKLGLESAKAFDIDPEAIRVSEENAEANGIKKGIVSFDTQGLEAGLSEAQANFVFANIQADILCSNTNVLLKAIAPKGVLAMSGILAHELEDVKDCFMKHAETLSLQVSAESRVMGEWADLCLKRS